ncbi:hypothetical protein NDU88_002786 [Pleurodeles waltl]|uniref:Uncharacterized protein n=1 Tax=Pleurodeles waltl TaxID=8319 RepID=A0AAV7TMM2_PLEWA|nr:hypothetical protein NDU88_002786 [Pleurodeles waltl]
MRTLPSPTAHHFESETVQQRKNMFTLFAAEQDNKRGCSHPRRNHCTTRVPKEISAMGRARTVPQPFLPAECFNRLLRQPFYSRPLSRGAAWPAAKPVQRLPGRAAARGGSRCRPLLLTPR